MLNLSLSLSLSLALSVQTFWMHGPLQTLHATHSSHHRHIVVKTAALGVQQSCGHIRKICHNPHAMCQSPTSLSLSLWWGFQTTPSVCYIGHDALSTKFLFQIGDDGQVACDDIIMPTITPKRPRALPKISITKIFTNRVEFCASDNAQLLPMIPTHSLPKKTIC